MTASQNENRRIRFFSTSTSRVALMAAAILAVLSVVLFIASQDTRAPDLDAARVEAILRNVADAVRRRDVRGLFADVADDAELFGERRERMERYAWRALREVAAGAVQIQWTAPRIRSEGGTGMAEFEVTVTESVANSTAVYYSGTVTLYLRKEKRPRWFGLSSEERWCIYRATSSTPVFAVD